MYHAVLDSTSSVIGIVVWDGKSPWQPPGGCTTISLSKHREIGIGWTYADGQFIPPAEP